MHYHLGSTLLWNSRSSGSAVTAPPGSSSLVPITNSLTPPAVQLSSVMPQLQRCTAKNGARCIIYFSPAKTLLTCSLPHLGHEVPWPVTPLKVFESVCCSVHRTQWGCSTRRSTVGEKNHVFFFFFSSPFWGELGVGQDILPTAMKKLHKIYDFKCHLRSIYDYCKLLYKMLNMF